MNQSPINSQKPLTIAPWLLAILIIIILVAVGFGWYFWSQSQPTETETPQTTTTTTSENTTPTSISTKNSVTPTADASTKTYRDEDSGISFSYPKDWQVIDDLGLGEGSGVTPLTINFAVQSKNNSEAKSLNDLTIVIYSRKATKLGYDDLYNSIINELHKSGAKTSSVKVGDKDATKYSDLGGLASNPTEIIYKNSDNYFLTIVNQQSQGMLHEEVSKEQFNEILASFRFVK